MTADLRFKKPSLLFTSLGDAGKTKNSRVPQLGKQSDQIDSNRMQMPRSPPGSTYLHQKQLAKLEEMNKNLNEIKERLTKTSVQCHMLQVDLVSLYDPQSIKTMKNTKDACNNCNKTVGNLKEQPTN